MEIHVANLYMYTEIVSIYHSLSVLIQQLVSVFLSSSLTCTGCFTFRLVVAVRSLRYSLYVFTKSFCVKYNCWFLLSFNESLTIPGPRQFTLHRFQDSIIVSLKQLCTLEVNPWSLNKIIDSKISDLESGVLKSQECQREGIDLLDIKSLSVDTKTKTCGWNAAGK